MRISSLDDWLSPTPVYTHSGKGYVLVGSSNGMLRLFDGLTGAVVCLGGERWLAGEWMVIAVLAATARRVGIVPH